MTELYSELSSEKSSELQKKINELKQTNKTSSVKKALNWLFLSEYKE